MSSTASPVDASRYRRAIAIIYGAVCHVAFTIGVGTMIWAMFFGMSRSFGRLETPWNIVANAALLIQFPILHSWLLTRSGGSILKRLAPNAFGSPMATTIYAIMASIQVFLLFAFWTPSGNIWWQADGAMLWAMAALYTLAWLLLLKAIWDAGLALQTGFLGWWAIANNRSPVFPSMPTNGLFRLVRQPIYVAFALTLWTVPTWTGDQLVIALVLSAYCLLGPLFKEARFRKRFGAAFVDYCRRVPYWLPWPRPAKIRNDLSIYDAAADWWSGDIAWLRALKNMVTVRLAFFDGIVGDWRGKRVLDLGCGGGFMAEAIASRKAVVVGIDPSEVAIGSARRHAAANDTDIEYVVGSGESLPFAGGGFDIVVCVDVLEHVHDLDRVLAEVRRVLRPGGVFLFDTINRTFLARLVMITLGENLLRILPKGTHDPQLFIRPAEIRSKLEAAGFLVGPFAGMGPRGLNRRFDIVFGRLPLLSVQYMGAGKC